MMGRNCRSGSRPPVVLWGSDGCEGSCVKDVAGWNATSLLSSAAETAGFRAAGPEKSASGSHLQIRVAHKVDIPGPPQKGV